MSRDRVYFLVRKLHSLTGIIPVGLFLLAHLYINSAALLGECAFTDGVRSINSIPYVHWIEIFGIIVPLAFHAIAGLWMVLVQARYNVGAYNYARNWWYALQRLSGLLLVGFLGWHLYDTVLAKAMGQVRLEQFYGHLAQGMSTDRLFLAIFVVGVLAASLHLANGLWGFCASWGVLQSRTAQRVGGKVFGIAGVVIFAAWFNIVFHFATGGASFIPVQEAPVECGAHHLEALDD